MLIKSIDSFIKLYESWGIASLTDVYLYLDVSLKAQAIAHDIIAIECDLLFLIFVKLSYSILGMWLLMCLI